MGVRAEEDVGATLGPEDEGREGDPLPATPDVREETEEVEVAIPFGSNRTRAMASKRKGRRASGRPLSAAQLRQRRDAALSRSRKFRGLRKSGKVSNVRQYRRRLSKARYLTRAQFLARRPGGSYRRYQRSIARRTGQTLRQVRRKVRGRPRTRTRRAVR
jgi:hypothetical protein